MAVIKNDQSAKLVLKVQTGTNASSNPVYASRTFGKVNPSIDDEDLFTIGQAIASLQSYPLAAVNRQNNSTLASE